MTFIDFPIVLSISQSICTTLPAMKRWDWARNVPPPYLVRLLMVVERAGREGFTKEGKPQLHELVRSNPKLNSALFWADVAEHRANSTHGPTLHYWQMHFNVTLHSGAFRKPTFRGSTPISLLAPLLTISKSR